MSTRISWDNYVLIHDIYQKISEILIHVLFIFREKELLVTMSFARRRTINAQTLFIFYDNSWVLFSYILRKTIFFSKMHLSLTKLLPFCFLTNNLLLPNMSCITYRLTSVYLKCFYQFLPFISIGRGFFFASCHIILASLSSILFDDYTNVQNTFLCYFVNSIHLI